jgi:hypothetical protein
LISFDSRTCTRPLAIVLQQGHLEASLRDARPVSQQDDQLLDFGSPSEFRTQKQHIKSLRRSPGKLLGVLATAMNPVRWLRVAHQMWLTERVRRCFD